MGDIIQLLPDNVANQIAAGEVIQRPASVIKELVENAVDAGATVVDVSVVDAGRTLIQVIDDGNGMSYTDARMAFERHATSKIRKADDLFALTTMGFRGEALASVAAVAQVELRTRQAGDDVGTLLVISGGKCLVQEPCACTAGSNFKVENLFFNVPARRRFLKSNATELNNILVAFERIALVCPHISFTLHNNGAEVFSLRAGNVRRRIADIFGRKTSQELLPVEVSTSMCRISGYVGKPESARKKGAHQYFFVNGRYMKHPYFNRAVANAFERLVPAGGQVPYFIYFDVRPEDIDVNIHPTKTEIKFENEQAIWQILAAVVREAVGKFNDIPSIDFNTQGRPDIPVFGPHDGVSVPKTVCNPQYNPFREPRGSVPLKERRPAGQWERLYGDASREKEEDAGLFGALSQDLAGGSPEDGSSGTLSQDPAEGRSPVHYQYKGRYIMTAVKSGLMVIDQHRAHVRILYERYLGRRGGAGCGSQKVLFPEVVHLSVPDSDMLGRIIGEMESMGFGLAAAGGGSYAVNAVPAGVEGLDIGALVADMVASAVGKGTCGDGETVRSLALGLARNAAVPYGQVLGNEEMEEIVNGLFACDNVNYTPDGKMILAILGQQEIERLLG